jgi:SAM-dependent methyltransferase
VTNLPYQGTELGLFAAAINWKRYYGRVISQYIGAEVLEVGAGLGTNTRLFADRRRRRWVCLEPDASLAASLRERLAALCQTVSGTTAELAESDVYDTVLYIDVLEHIMDDHAELHRAARHLMPGGHLVVLAPAHQFLYTPFDRAIGHYRRYTVSALRGLAPPELAVVDARYLDSVGMLASLGNRLLLRQAMPTERQLRVWDRVLVPLSRVIDVLLRHRAGKSALVVWRKQ